MDFIERLLGVSPDGGNGLVEWCLFLVPVFAAIAILHYTIHRGAQDSTPHRRFMGSLYRRF